METNEKFSRFLWAAGISTFDKQTEQDATRAAGAA